MAVLFDGQPSQPKTLEEVVGQAVGAASVCWEDPSGAGVFESDRAKEISEEVVGWVNEHYVPREVQDGEDAPPQMPNGIDLVEVYNDGTGSDQPWHWRRWSHGNHKKIGSGGEPFSSESAAIQAAHRANPTGVQIRVANGG